MAAIIAPMFTGGPDGWATDIIYIYELILFDIFVLCDWSTRNKITI